jgi:hypothetical protein
MLRQEFINIENFDKKNIVNAFQKMKKYAVTGLLLQEDDNENILMELYFKILNDFFEKIFIYKDYNPYSFAILKKKSITIGNGAGFYIKTNELKLKKNKEYLIVLIESDLIKKLEDERLQFRQGNY